MTENAWNVMREKEIEVPARQSYKAMLIDDILKDQTDGKWTRETLMAKSTKALENIYDYLQ